MTLTQGVTCDIALAFQPQDILSGNQARPVTLSLSTPSHVVDTLRIRLADLARRLPPTPTNLTTFPVSSGLGVSWRGTYYDADAYRLERRTDGGDWTTATTATASRQTDGYFFVDHDTAPGQHVAYRVFAVASGLDSVASTVEGTRPVAASTPTSTSTVAFLSNDDRVAHATVVDGQDGGTVVTSYNGLPRINASARDSSGTVTAATGLTLPFLPGPGEYRVADRTMGADFSPSSSYQCSTWSDRVLEVRALEYDDTGRPVLLDASWVGRCAYGTVSRVEVRLGVDTPVVLPKADPDRVGQLRTYAGRPLTRTVTVTNPGPNALTLGQATTRGDAAADWSVVGNGCQAVQLLAGETCDVTVQFAFTRAGARPAALEVAAEDATGALAPVTVPLDGFGTTPPLSELMGTLTPSIHAMLAYWNKPYDDGGEPVTSYEVERQVDGGAWTRVADVDATVDPYRPAFADKEPAAGHRYSYRVRARNAAGAGAWNDLVFGNREVSERGVVVSGSRATTGPRGLFQVAEADWYAPIVPLTDDPDHDYRDPASSPGGARLVFSRSVGDGSDDEYDLWTGTRTQPAGVRVTTMSGAERDAQFSPDTTRIAFTHESAGQRSVWVVDADGGNARQVRADAASPAWTPDGSGLVVEDDFVGDAPLLRLDLAAGTATPIAGTGGGSEPDVSRSGNLAYADANGRIMQLAAGQSAPTVLKTPSYDRRLSAPVYARNGDVLVETTRVSSGRSESEVTSRLAVVGEPGLLFDDHRAPTVAAAGLRDSVAGSPSFSVTATDNGGTPDSALRPECRLDGAALVAVRGTDDAAVADRRPARVLPARRRRGRARRHDRHPVLVRHDRSHHPAVRPLGHRRARRTGDLRLGRLGRGHRRRLLRGLRAHGVAHLRLRCLPPPGRLDGRRRAVLVDDDPGARAGDVRPGAFARPDGAVLAVHRAVHGPPARRPVAAAVDRLEAADRRQRARAHDDDRGTQRRQPRHGRDRDRPSDRCPRHHLPHLRLREVLRRVDVRGVRRSSPAPRPARSR